MAMVIENKLTAKLQAAEERITELDLIIETGNGMITDAMQTMNELKDRAEAAEALLARIAQITDQPFTETNEHLPDWVATILRTRVGHEAEHVAVIYRQKKLVEDELRDCESSLKCAEEQIRLRDEALTNLEAEFDTTCNAEELRQVREDNKRITIQRDYALDDLKAEIANHREDSAALESMRETANEANRVHIEMHNQITVLQAEVARLKETESVGGSLNIIIGLRNHIAELEAGREDLLEKALGEDIWLRFEGKDWVLIEAVTKALLGGEGK